MKSLLNFRLIMSIGSGNTRAQRPVLAEHSSIFRPDIKKNVTISNTHDFPPRSSAVASGKFRKPFFLPVAEIDQFFQKRMRRGNQPGNFRDPAILAAVSSAAAGSCGRTITGGRDPGFLGS